MLILLKEGPTPGYMKLVDSSAAVKFASNGDSCTITNVANSWSAAAVGAAYYENTPAFGNTRRPILEEYSSAGGCPIFFDLDGTRRSQPDLRPQPRFVGPDVATTFFGTMNSNVTGPDGGQLGVLEFPGTSAAAPHVAGVAALMLSVQPQLLPEEIYLALEGTAVDMNDPKSPGFNFGCDYATGNGLVDAEASLQFVEDFLLSGEKDDDGGIARKGKSSKGSKKGSKGSKGSGGSAGYSDDDYYYHHPSPSPKGSSSVPFFVPS